MGKARTYLVGLAIATALIAGSFHPVEAVSLACPQLCLTGGLLGGLSTSATVDLVDANRVRAANGNESRTYSYSLTAIDITDGSPLGSFSIFIEVAGMESDGTFNGAGNAHLGQSGGNTVSIPVTLTDDGASVSANGTGSDTFQLFEVGGIGEAIYRSSSDPHWDTPSEDECEGHDNDTGLGHLIGGGGGHDCD